MQQLKIREIFSSVLSLIQTKEIRSEHKELYFSAALEIRAVGYKQDG